MPDAVTNLAWSLEGGCLAAGCLTGEVLVVRSDSTVKNRLPAGDQPISCLGWSSDGYWLASASRGGSLAMLGPGGVEERLELGCWTQSIAWAPDQSILAAATGHDIHVLDTGGNRVAGYPLHPGRVNHLCWDRSSGNLLAGTSGGVGFYDPSLPGTDPVAFAPSSGTILTVAPSPQAGLIAAGRSNGSVIVWPADGGGATALTGSRGGVSLLSWSSDGGHLTVAAYDELTVWRCTGEGFDTEGRVNLAVPSAVPGSICYHPSLPVLAWGGEHGHVCLWAPDFGRDPLAAFELSADVTALCWHPTGCSLAAATSSGEISVLDVTGDASGVDSVGISSDGRSGEVEPN